jgi:CBS domain containing-hemolysin-like protein
MLAVGVLAILVLVAANAFFVLSEFALIAVDRGQLQERAEGGDARVRALVKSTHELTRHLSAAQFGITISSLLIGFVSEPLVASAIHPFVSGLPLLEEDLALALSLGLALALSTYLQLVLGEQVPKAMAIASPMRFGLLVIRALRVFAWLVGPVVRLLNGLADAVVRRLGSEPRSELTAARSIEELEVVIRESAARGTLDRTTARLLSRAIKFAGRTAHDAMTPRNQVVTAPGTASSGDLLIAAARSGHTGIPVLGPNPEEIIGVGRVEDALAIPPGQRAQTRLSSLAQPALVVPESKDLLSLISEMRKQRIQLAAVIDEYGGLAGIVTDEDVLEELVGEIEEGRPGARVTREAGLVPGWAREDQAREETGFAIPDGHGEYDTLAGFLLSRLGRIPSVGETTSVEGWTLEIVEMDERRIAWVRVTPPAERHGEGAAT